MKHRATMSGLWGVLESLDSHYSLAYTSKAMSNRVLPQTARHPSGGILLILTFLVGELLKHYALPWVEKLDSETGSAITFLAKLARALADWSISHPSEIALVLAVACALFLVIRAQLSRSRGTGSRKLLRWMARGKPLAPAQRRGL
jgi:type II secretory pathway component PulF